MESLDRIPYLTILFKNNLKPFEVPAFRGAVISKVPPELTLFHNHIGDSFRFSYPLIQYKTIGGKAAIFSLGEGTREIANFFSGNDLDLKIGQREESFSVENVWANQWLLQTWNDSFHYSIRRWLPLNSKNLAEFNRMEGIAERTRFLESILVGNMLSMSKGLGHFFESTVSCVITGIDNARLYTYKGVKMQGFDIRCKTNLYLPDFIGLGKGSSMGFGVVKTVRTHNTEQSNDGNG